jgi:hypothetical protein
MVRSGDAGAGSGEGEARWPRWGPIPNERADRFIVRVSVDNEGGVTGVVERVRTGHKERMHGLGDIARIIAMMLAGPAEAP